MPDWMGSIAVFAMPAMLCLILLFGAWKQVPLYDTFLKGAREGLSVGVDILPPILGFLVAMGMFRASGALELLVKIVKPFTDFLGFPSELLPFALLRPMSGGGSLALATELFRRFGTDSFVGRAVSVMMGSTETTFYTIAVYFGAISVKNTRHTLKCALLADAAGILFSVWICRWFFPA